MLALLFALSAFASPAPISLLCATDMPTTSFELAQSGNDVILKVKHANGTPYMPIHEGVVVPHDFDYLQFKANNLTKLGAYTEFKFAADKCKTFGHGLIACSDGETKKFNGVTMQALDFFTTRVHESTMGTEVDYWKATLSIWSPDFVPVMDMTMVYATENCKSSF
jgi:hypothetical protein